MRKFFAVLFALFAVSVFADTEHFISNCAGVPLVWKSSNVEGINADSFTAAASLGLSYSLFFNDVLGLYVEADFFFPQRISYDYGNGKVVTGYDDYCFTLIPRLGVGVCF